MVAGQTIKGDVVLMSSCHESHQVGLSTSHLSLGTDERNSIQGQVQVEADTSKGHMGVWMNLCMDACMRPGSCAVPGIQAASMGPFATCLLAR